MDRPLGPTSFQQILWKRLASLHLEKRDVAALCRLLQIGEEKKTLKMGKPAEKSLRGGILEGGGKE